MMKLMIFAGTTEGRELCERCIKDNRLIIDAYVATSLGADMLPKSMALETHIGRLDAIGIASEIKRIQPDMVIDATHPYAEEITKNILLATKATGVKYIRLLRKESPKAIDGIYAEDYAKAVKIVNRSKGNILITTGSKELDRYKDIVDIEHRGFLRMLPEEDNVIAAIKAGFNRNNIELGRGPFSVEQNIDTINKFNIKYLITKDTGLMKMATRLIRYGRLYRIRLIQSISAL
jgi:precorrin-6Y C5,15-methyltransferase (decarboxylating)